MSYGTTQERARALAAALTEARAGQHGLSAHGWGKMVSRYVAQPHSWTEGADFKPVTWGIVERWQYVDRPDLGELGGEFIALAAIHEALAAPCVAEYLRKHVAN